jgi:glycosyltransferase domain-containing protein
MSPVKSEDCPLEKHGESSLDHCVDNLKSLTIIIPSYSRHSHLKSVIGYWGGRPANLFIVDGSLDKLEFDDINYLPSNINYCHMPEVAVEDRLMYAGQHADTKYVVTMGDDECFSELALSACIAMLESDPAISACGGMPVGFKRENKTLSFRRVYSELMSHNSLSDCPSRRLIESMALYSSSTFYAVHRRQNWIHSIRASLEGVMTGRYAHELIFELTSAAIGKTVTIPIAYWFRNYDNPPIREVFVEKTDGGALPIPFADWWLNPKNNQLKSRMMQSIADLISIRNGEKRRVLLYSIERAFNLFCEGQGVNLTCKDIFRPRFYSIRDKADYAYVKRIRPDDVKSNIFKTFLDFDRSSTWVSQHALDKFIARTGIFYDSVECSRIEDYLSRICRIS